MIVAKINFASHKQDIEVACSRLSDGEDDA